MKPPKSRTRYPQVLMFLIFYDRWVHKGKFRAKAIGVAATSEKKHLSEVAALFPTWLFSGVHQSTQFAGEPGRAQQQASLEEIPRHRLPRALSEAVSRAAAHCSAAANQRFLQNLFRKSKSSRPIIKPPKAGHFYQEGTI